MRAARSSCFRLLQYKHTLATILWLPDVWIGDSQVQRRFVSTMTRPHLRCVGCEMWGPVQWTNEERTRPVGEQNNRTEGSWRAHMLLARSGNAASLAPLGRWKLGV